MDHSYDECTHVLNHRGVGGLLLSFDVGCDKYDGQQPFELESCGAR